MTEHADRDPDLRAQPAWNPEDRGFLGPRHGRAVALRNLCLS
jgi:hypothetical protein